MNKYHIADAALGLRHMFIQDLVLEAQIGVNAEERGRTQHIRINLDLAVDDATACSRSLDRSHEDELACVVDYGSIVKSVCNVVAAGHVQLVETLAERLAEICLEDHRVAIVWVKVEKLDVFRNAASVGIQIQRQRR